jgi:hypothetical protein
MIDLVCLWYFSYQMQSSRDRIVVASREQKWIRYCYKRSSHAGHGWIQTPGAHWARDGPACNQYVYTVKLPVMLHYKLSQKLKLIESGKFNRLIITLTLPLKCGLKLSSNR